MRVLAFWAGVAGVAVLASQGALLAVYLSFVGAHDAETVLPAATLISTIAHLVFALLLSAFFFLYAVTKRET